MKNVFALLEKYLALAIAGVHAANTVLGASNADKRATVLETVVKVADAVAQASGNPQVHLVGAIIDVVATAVNTLMSKTPAASAAQ